MGQKIFFIAGDESFELLTLVKIAINGSLWLNMGGSLQAESESMKQIYVGCVKLPLKLLKEGQIDAEGGEEDPILFIQGGQKFQHPWPVYE